MTTRKKSRLPDHFGRVTAIADDHVRLDRRVFKLKELAASLEKAAPSASRELDALRVECEALVATMTRHFAAEEANSYFGVVMAQEPSTCSTIVQLCAEHAEMLRMLGELMTVCTAGELDPSTAADVLQRVTVFAERLQLHEHMESTLMQIFLLGSDRAARS